MDGKHIPGRGCTCMAWNADECGCGVDWRSSREVELEEMLKMHPVSPDEIWVTLRDPTRIPQYLAARESYWAGRLAASEARARELWEALDELLGGVAQGTLDFAAAVEMQEKHADHFRKDDGK